ncbi:MAG: RNA-binding S4 domain-containing protein [Planctomycetota bacterium]
MSELNREDASSPTEKSRKSSKAEPDRIKLDQFLKVQGLVQTGGRAKLLIQSGGVKVNGEVETRRGRRLRPGDCVQVFDQTLRIELADQ